MTSQETAKGTTLSHFYDVSFSYKVINHKRNIHILHLEAWHISIINIYCNCHDSSIKSSLSCHLLDT